jgi:hypothetical protein
MPAALLRINLRQYSSIDGRGWQSETELNAKYTPCFFISHNTRSLANSLAR